MNRMKRMMTAIVENVEEGMTKMESCGLAVMEVVKDGITSFVLVWMKRVYQKTFTAITAPTDCHVPLYPSYTAISCIYTRCTLYIPTYIFHLYSLFSYLHATTHLQTCTPPPVRMHHVFRITRTCSTIPAYSRCGKSGRN